LATHLVRREDDDFLPVASRLEVREELVLCEREEATAREGSALAARARPVALNSTTLRISGQIRTAARR